MRNLVLKNLFWVAGLLLPAATVLGQKDSTSVNHFDDLSLKDLLNMKIVTASKNSESWFEAPLSASVVTKEEILRTGCTSIMEALRLVPGLIVREQSNGNYDIHLRGLDNTPPNASFDFASTTMLVMIDNRPIYSYLRGGTFWETLPVDLNDVEKIEVVRGPAAALYGPNAVNGVINIITRRPRQEGLYLLADAQQGTNQTIINKISIGHKSSKWDLVLSGNYQKRERSQTSYFEFNRNQALNDPDYFLSFTGVPWTNVDIRFPEPELAMEKYATNGFVTFRPSEKVRFDLSTGAQHSKVQKVTAENEITPLSTASSDSKYADLRMQLLGITGQVSYNAGVQNVDFDPGNKFKFHTFDAGIEYNFVRKNLSLTPGLSFRSAVYDDTKYSDLANKSGIFNARGEITTRSASLRGEYKLLNDKLRLVAGIAANKFNYPDTVYLSTQFAATYKIGKDQMIRAVLSRAPRSSNVFETYVDQTIAYFPSGFQEYTRFGIWGNKNLKLLTADLIELGYRANICSNFNVDLEVFDVRSKNHSLVIEDRSYTRMEGPNTIIEVPIMSMNLPLRVHQLGATVSVMYSSKKWQVKPFVTVQRTHLKNYSPYSITPEASMGPNHIYSGVGRVTKHTGTPAVFGGGSVNFIPSAKLNFNLNAYYYTEQDYYHLSNFLFQDGVRGIDHIKGKVILNFTATYEPVAGLKFFASGKNLLNDKSREFFHTDKVPFRLLGGLHFEL
jgi:iron complex outermembrane recepter protein